MSEFGRDFNRWYLRTAVVEIRAWLPWIILAAVIAGLIGGFVSPMLRGSV